MTESRRKGIHRYPTGVRASPYLQFAIDEGAIAAVPYNRMWLPVGFGRDPRVEYDALLNQVVLWDVGCERALEFTGPDATAFADYLLTRDIAALGVGVARHALSLFEDGTIQNEAIVMRLDVDRIWVCYGPSDFPGWARAIALHSGYRVELREAPVSPLALQGPRARDVMEDLAPEVASLPRFHWAWTTIAGEDVLVSRTGWSGEFGYEVFAPDTEPARRVWREVHRAALPHGVLISAVNSLRAWERGVTDIRVGDNLGINPLEVGLERAVDFEKRAPFIGAERLHLIRAGGARRRTVAFTVDAEDVPDHQDFWPVAVRGDEANVVGSTWHVVYSYALERFAGDALIDGNVADGTELELLSPAGPLPVTIVPRPVAGRAAATT